MAGRKPYINYAGTGGFGSDSGFIPTGEIRWQDSQGKWHTTYTNSPGGSPTPGGAGVAPRSPTYPSGTGGPGTTVPATTGAPPLPATPTVPPSTGGALPNVAPTGMGTTASAIPGYIETARELGNLARDWEKGRDKARNDASLDAYQQNVANEARFRSMLESRRLSLEAPQRRADNSLRGDRLANAQDLEITLPSNIPASTMTGGFRPSMWSENTRQLGRQMSADALAGSGTDELTGLPVQGAPQPNVLDTALDIASLGTSIPYKRNGRWVSPNNPDDLDPYTNEPRR